MKKNRLFFMFAALLVAAAVMFSCQKEEVVSFEDGLMLKGGTAGVFEWADPVYAGVAHNFCLYFDQDYNGSSKPKETSVKADIELLGDDPSTLEVETSYWAPLLNGKGNTSYCANATILEAGIYNLRYQIGGGKPIEGLTVTVINPCVTKLVGKAVSCGTEREAEYTFTHDGAIGYVKIQGGLTNFTGADAVVTAPVGYTVSQTTPGGSSNRIISVEGPASCTPLVINIKWNSTNSGGVITGDWSVKDVNGVELAASLAGLECK